MAKIVRLGSPACKGQNPGIAQTSLQASALMTPGPDDYPSPQVEDVYEAFTSADYNG